MTRFGTAVSKDDGSTAHSDSNPARSRAARLAAGMLVSLAALLMLAGLLAVTAGAASGWSIHDQSLYRGWDSTGGWTTSQESKKIRINATTRSAVSGPPNAPILRGMDIYDGKLKVNGELYFGIEVPVEEISSVVSSFKVQWKSGSQEYDSSRQAVISPTLGLPATPGNKTSFVFVDYEITGLTNGVEYTVRIIGTNADGDGPPSAEKSATPNTKPEELRELILDIVEEHESSYPWLRDTWNYIQSNNVQLYVPNYGSSRVGHYCSSGPSLPSCYISMMIVTASVLDGDDASKKWTILHELAHIYTLANGISASPGPLAMAHLYFDSLGSSCAPSELYADILASVALGGSTTQASYWNGCGGSNTAAALAVVRSALSGQTPSWFNGTYNNSNGDPDLEQVWADLMALDSGVNTGETRKTVAYQLRNEFGGYCDEESTSYALRYDSTSRAVTKNPWSAGGCVPSAPTSLTAVLGGDGKVSVSWEAPASDGGSLLRGYKVQWKSGSEDYDEYSRQLLELFSSSDTFRPSHMSKTISGLTNGVEYTFRVFAYNYNYNQNRDGDGDGATTEVTITPSATDAVAPGILSATVERARLTLTYNEALDEASAPATSAFAVSVAGSSRSVDQVSIKGSAVVLTLSSAAAQGDSVTVSYTVPTDANAPRIQDAAGDDAAAITAKTVTNDTPPVSSDATLRSLSYAYGLQPCAQGSTTQCARHGGLNPGSAELSIDVGASIDLIAFRARPTHARATVAYGPPADAGSTAEAYPYEVSLSDGENVITITLTAEDGVTTRTYAITVTRSDNSPAAGLVAISGMGRVGETLTASLFGIVDLDGLSNPTFSYQWTSSDGTTDTDISGATGSSYTLAAADVGKTVKVRVTFTDDESHTETLTSVETAAVEPAASEATAQEPLSATFDSLPPAHDGSTALSFTLRFSEEIAVSDVAMRDEVLGVSGGSVTNAQRSDPSSTLSWEITIEPDGDGDVFVVLQSGRACDETGAVCTGDGGRLVTGLAVLVPGPLSVANSVVNTPPTGLPAISGTAQVGETLTASVTGIADADGLTSATFAYQWLSSDGTTDAGIQGATGSNYTLASGDAGKTVKVRVTFTDDGGTEESLISAATEPVTVPLTASFENVPESHDGSTAFTFELRFSEEFAISYRTVRDSVLEVTGGTVKRAKRLAKPSNTGWRISVRPTTDGDVTVVLPANRACGDTGAVCTNDDRRLSNALALTVRGPASPDNRAPTGLPAISGTARVGQTLNASVDGIEDADGLTGVTFAYQWLSHHGTTETEIAGATESTYTLTEAEESRTITVRVTFTDGRGTEETLVSVATAAVAGAATAVSLPEVSIAAVSSPVAEGTDAAFFLTRTGDTAAALTVTVEVAESGAMVKGAAPIEVTFGVGANTASLIVATEDDEAVEAASTITASLAAGNGYTVSAAGGSAVVTAEDDDAAPVVTTASPIPVPENGTAVATLQATDADTPAADLAWSIAGGADAGAFSLTAEGVLAFRSAKDFEAPDDADTDGDYEVTVRVGDGANTAEAALTVRLTDVDDTAPGLTEATVNGTALTLTFDEVLDGGSAPPATAFAVAVDDAARAVDTVEIAGSTATLTLASPVAAGATVAAAYTPPSGAGATPIRDVAGNAVAGFSDRSVTNEAVNAEPTGLPTISGTVQVGETLTASVDGIEDADGLMDVTFAYQWVSNDGTAETDIEGATEASYTLVAADAGRTVKVRVTFTDGGGTEETLESEATASVAALPVEVSITADASPVTEGADAAFTLRRTGDTAAPLTVAVTVSQAGAVLSGSPPTAVTFEAGASEAKLRVAMADDGAAEADARVTVSVAPGTGYTVAAGAGTAGIDVFDNDAATAALAEIEVWSADMAVADLGTDGGYGAVSADGFSNVAGSAAVGMRWLWYWAPERTLYMALARPLADSAELTLHLGGVAVALADGGSGDASFTWRGVDLDWAGGETVPVRMTRPGEAQATPAGPGVSVADAEVREAAGAVLAFRITLAAAQPTAVSVRYATSDGTATAGADYVAVSGSLRFAPGVTERTVVVRVLEDAHDEGSETMTLTLSAPFGAELADAQATGMIVNTDPLQRAWLARFGRAVADHVLDAVGARFEGGSSGPAQLTLGGQQVLLDAAWPAGDGAFSAALIGQGGLKPGLTGVGDFGANLTDRRAVLWREGDDSPPRGRSR